MKRRWQVMTSRNCSSKGMLRDSTHRSLWAFVNCPKLCGQYKKEPLVGNIEF